MPGSRGPSYWTETAGEPLTPGSSRAFQTSLPNASKTRTSYQSSLESSAQTSSGFEVTLSGAFVPGPIVSRASVTLKDSAITICVSPGGSHVQGDEGTGDFGVGIPNERVVLVGRQDGVAPDGHTGDRERAGHVRRPGSGSSEAARDLAARRIAIERVLDDEDDARGRASRGVDDLHIARHGRGGLREPGEHDTFERALRHLDALAPNLNVGGRCPRRARPPKRRWGARRADRSETLGSLAPRRAGELGAPSSSRTAGTASA